MQEQLAGWLEQRLPRISRLKLDPNRTRVTHVLNWGGFVNASFSVEDDSVQYHVKITNDADNVVKLQRWYGIHALLSQRYRAPEVIDWLDFPEIGFAGLLQKQIRGRTASFRDDPDLLQQLIQLMSRLHNDADLRSHLNASDSPKTCLGHFVETYIERFNADLEAVVAEPPPFVSSALLKWMRNETERLQATANGVDAFRVLANDPVHADLHEGNVLVTSDGWFVVDWDDLALGDAALDFAILCWPVVFRGGSWRDIAIPHMNHGFRERIEVCFRAQLLDEVIDPLADYVAAATVPSKQSEVRLVKRQQHEEALEKYRRQYACS